MGPLPRHTKMCAAGALALQILACRVGSLEAWINKVYEALWDLPRSGRLWGPTKTLCSTFLERCLLPKQHLDILIWNQQALSIRAVSTRTKAPYNIRRQTSTQVTSN